MPNLGRLEDEKPIDYYCSLFLVLFPPRSPELQMPFLDIAIQGCVLESGIKSNDTLSLAFSRLLPHPRLARTFHLERQFLPPSFSQPINSDSTVSISPSPNLWPRILIFLMALADRAMVGRRALIGGLIARAGLRRNVPDEALDYNFSPVQETLKELWRAAFPDVHLEGLISGQWKEMGWQGINPSTDFRGGGYIALENLLFFAKVFPNSFHRLLLKQEGKRATWEYPFATAGINTTYMLIKMLDLLSEKPRSRAALNFIRLLGEDEEAFEVLYCIAFVMLDAKWLALGASYMEFNEVLQATRAQLERDLSPEDVKRVRDLPAYNLLYQ